MTTDFDTPDDTTKFIPVQPEQPVFPEKRTFRAWHKPRKQWVRQYQWKALTEIVAHAGSFPNDARVLRYLGLTGEDLLDVRTLYPLCERYDLDLKYVGINNANVGGAADLRLNVAEDDLRSRARIHKLSRVERGRVEDVANASSVLLERVRENGPYHVINIDLCDNVAKQTPHGAAPPTYIDAVAAFLGLQAKTQLQPWALFLTTRVRPTEIHSNNLAAFVNAIKDNIASNKQFEDHFAQLTGSGTMSNVLDAPEKLNLSEFKNVFCVGLGKWMARYLLLATPPCKLTMQCSGYYSVYADGPDMVSLAFLCEPLAAAGSDRYGLAQGHRQREELDEKMIALSIVQSTGKMIDIDALLREDEGLYRQMVLESEELLREAHYDIDAYRKWLAGRGGVVAR